MVTRLKPIVPQTTRHNWLTNTILLQLNALLMQCEPMQQTGFTKGHTIFKDIFSIRYLWDDATEGVGYY